MKKVMVFGTFDILHPGHIYFLKNAKKYGDTLFVIISRDSTVKHIKGKSPLHNEKERLKKIQQLHFVNYVILGNKRDKYFVIEKIKPDIICLGYDQRISVNELRKELKKRNIKARIIRLKPYKEHLYKSSKLRSIS